MSDRFTRREATFNLAGTAALLAGAPSGAAAVASEAGRKTQIRARPESIALDPRRTALLVIDMQNDFGVKGGMFESAGIDISGIRAVIPAIRASVEAARNAGIHVVYLKMGFLPDLSDAGPTSSPNMVKHAALKVGATVTAPDGSSSRILVRDTWNTEIIPELRPEPGDSVLYKTRFSGFYRTGLHEMLRRRGITDLVVTGCTTSICVESTVRDAMFRDYRCVVLEDCTAEPIGANEARTNHQASLLAMQILFAWISDSTEFCRAIAVG